VTLKSIYIATQPLKRRAAGRVLPWPNWRHIPGDLLNLCESFECRRRFTYLFDAWDCCKKPPPAFSPCCRAHVLDLRSAGQIWCDLAETNFFDHSRKLL